MAVEFFMLPLANVVQKAGGSIADVAKWSFLCLLNLLQFVQIKGQVSMLVPLKSSAPSGAGRGMCDTNTSLDALVYKMTKGICQLILVDDRVYVPATAI